MNPQINEGQKQVQMTPAEVANLNVVYKKAAQNRPALDGLLNKVGQRSGGRVISNYKNPTTTIAKVQEKQQEDPKRDYTLNDVNDVARGRLVYNSLDAMRKGIGTFKQEAKQSGVVIAKQQDFFNKPEGGYRGYHIDIAFPNGQHSEVQFHTPQSYANAMATHAVHAEYGDNPPDNLEDQTKKTGNLIMKLPNKVSDDISTANEIKNAPMMAQAQQQAQNVINAPIPQHTPFDIPKMTMQPPSRAAFPPSKGGVGVGKSPASPEMIQSAIQLLQGNLNKEDVKTIGNFAQAVETGKDKGNLGETGKTMQSLTENVFGKQAANWSNKQIKNAWDQVMQGAVGAQYQ